MTRLRRGDMPLLEPMMTNFADAYMPHQASIVKNCHHTFLTISTAVDHLLGPENISHTDMYLVMTLSQVML